MNSKFPFSFEVICTGIDTNYCKEFGMGIADSFADAARQIEENYGNDLISITDITLFEESGGLLYVSKETIDDYRYNRYPSPIPCDEFGKPIDVLGSPTAKTEQAQSRGIILPRADYESLPQDIKNQWFLRNINDKTYAIGYEIHPSPNPNSNTPTIIMNDNQFIQSLREKAGIAIGKNDIQWFNNK